MDNILFEKIWEDESIIELKITAISNFVTAYQTCYIQEQGIHDISNQISEYVNDYTKNCYIQIGNKEGNHTPAFSMNILSSDLSGHSKIEVDLEIADNDDRSHRCIYYVKGELGAIERLGMCLNKLCSGSIGEEVSLFEK